jgi:hypothetical protein
VWPMATMWGRLDGARATSTPGIGTSNVGGSGAGTEHVVSSHWRRGHIFFTLGGRHAWLHRMVRHCTQFEHSKA